MNEKYQFIRRDLWTIMILIVVLLVATGILFVVDQQQHFIDAWASQFYRFLLRQ